MQGFLKPSLNWPLPAPDAESWWDWAAIVCLNSGGLVRDMPFPTRSMYPHKEDWRLWASMLTFRLI